MDWNFNGITFRVVVLDCNYIIGCYCTAHGCEWYCPGTEYVSKQRAKAHSYKHLA